MTVAGVREQVETEVAPPRRREERPARPSLKPGTIALAGLAIGVLVLVAETLNRRLSTDVFWQLAAGQWMLTHHALIGHDPFSYTESHRRWVNDEWGSEVVLALLFRAIGAAAYNVIAIVTGSVCLICSLAYARALGARGGRLAAIAILLALGICNFVTQDRGLSFSLIWLPLELLLLHRARSNPRWHWGLVPLCVLWVNTHGSILLGLAVLGIELAWAVLPAGLVERVGGVGRSPHPGALGLAAAGSLVASCISPYGPGLLAYDLSVSRNPQIVASIVEWQSPNFHSTLVLLFFLIPFTVLAVATRRRPVALLETTLVIVFLLCALRSERFVIYLMVATVGLVATLPPRPEWGRLARRVSGAVALGLVVGLLEIPSVPAGSVTTDTPVQVFNFLAAHPGRIFTQYTWGDYSIARHRQTFADGRTDLFTGKVLTQFFAVGNVSTDPDPTLLRYHVDYVVWARGSALYEYLVHDPRWKVVDRTAPAVVFARRSAWSGMSAPIGARVLQ